MRLLDKIFILEAEELSEGPMMDKAKKIAANAAMIGSLAFAGNAIKDYVDQKPPEVASKNTGTQIFGDGDWFGAANLAKPDAPIKVQGETQLQKDYRMMALTIWGEARNLGPEGMRAVGHVIKNRAESGVARFGGTIASVTTASKQFSCWDNNDPNRERMLNIHNLSPNSKDYQAWQEAKKIARNIVLNKDKDITKGSRYYHTDKVKPVWRTKLEKVGKIGNHIFYRDKA